MEHKRKYVYDYPENREVNEQLKIGDQTDIAASLKLSENYVGKVLRGVRQNAEVIKMARQIIEDRASRRKPFESQAE